MKKLTYLFIGCVLLVPALSAQQSFVYQNHHEGTFRFLSGDEFNSEIEFNIGDIIAGQVNTPNGPAVTISAKGGTPMLEAGFPDLPKFTSSIVVPDDQNMQIQVVSSSYIDFPNIDVAPSKGHLLRTINPSDVPFFYHDIYSNNVFYPFDLAYLNHPYILRDFRAQTITVNPVQYNAVTKTLRVYTYLKLSISPSEVEPENVFVRNPDAIYTEKEFNSLYGRRFLNYNNTSRYTAVNDNGSMLIICHQPFEQYMNDFVTWKNQRGMKTVMVNTMTTGTTTSAIKTYIQNYYTANPDLKYVLFVGDDAQIPAAQPDGGNGLAGPSDNYYGYLTGNDDYPEIFVGRFSATSPAHVTTQSQRSIAYEKTPTIQGSFGKSVHIGSSEGPGDDGEMDYQHQRNLRAMLLGYTYTSGDEFYDGSQGGADAPGNPTANDVADALDNGRGVVLYTGHGSNQSCATSGFSSTEVQNLQNADMLPFIWSVACVNGEFTTTTCLAEYCLRSTNGSGQPVGAVATLMSTINQYWNEPMEGQDEMVNLLTTAVVGYDKKTFGALSMNGCMQMNDAYGSSGMDMTDTWTCFGDPSLMVRTTTPLALTANHVTADVPGITNVSVDCNVEGAFVALSMGNNILGTGTISGGSADITIPAANEGDVITVIVTAFNYVPHQGTVTITSTAVGLNENQLPGVQIYPNPATEFIAVQSANGISVDRILVYDMTGKIIYTQYSSVSGQYLIPADGWAKGTYNVQLSSNGKTSTYKVVLQ